MSGGFGCEFRDQADSMDMEVGLDLGWSRLRGDECIISGNAVGVVK